MLLNSDKTDLMSTSLSYSNNFDEDILLNNVMIRQSDQKKNIESHKSAVACFAHNNILVAQYRNLNRLNH